MRTIAIANQKGGCGKTTTAVNLSACLSFLGANVLLVDLDSQGHAGLALGVRTEELEHTLYNVLSPATTQPCKLADVIIEVAPHLHLAPSRIDLSALEPELTGLDGRERRLSAALASVVDRYDFVILDCAPGLGITTFNALHAADEALIPVDTSIFSLHGIGRFLETLAVAETSFGKRFGIHVLITRFNARTRLAREFKAELLKHFEGLLMTDEIRTTVRLSVAASHGKSIADFDRRCGGFRDYMRCAAEISERGGSVKTQARPTWMDEGARAPVATAAASPRGSMKIIGHAPPTPAPLTSLDPGATLLNSTGTARVVCFVFCNQQARQVEIAGDFNEWAPELLQSQGDGRWSFKAQLAPGNHPYQFIVDGQWTADPANGDTRRNPYGGVDSVVHVVA